MPKQVGSVVFRFRSCLNSVALYCRMFFTAFKVEEAQLETVYSRCTGEIVREFTKLTTLDRKKGGRAYLDAVFDLVNSLKIPDGLFA